MFDDAPDLTPDLEWLLKSGQAHPAALIELLLEEYAAPVYRLAAVYLGSDADARRAVLEMAVAAVQQAHRFSPESGVRLWVYTLAVAAIRRAAFWQAAGRFLKPRNSSKADVIQCRPELDALPDTQRMALLLRYVAGFSSGEVNRIMRIAKKEIHWVGKPADKGLGAYIGGLKAPSDYVQSLYTGGLSHVRSFNLREVESASIRVDPRPIDFCPAAKRGDDPAGNAPGEKIEALWQDSGASPGAAGELDAWGANFSAEVSARWPDLRTDEISEMTRLALARFEARRNNWLSARSLREAAVWGGLILLVIFFIGKIGGNVRAPEIFPTTTPTRFIPATLGPPIPVAPQRSISTPPLTVESSPGDIYERMARSPSAWHTLWADALVILYGPPGYVGPPRVYRCQVWLYVSNAFIVFGPLDDPPEMAWPFDSDNLPVAVYGSSSLASIYSNQNSGSFEYFVSTVYPAYLSKMFYPAETTAHPIPDRVEVVAGREALVALDDSSEMWIDATTGVVLRRRWLHPAEPRIIRVETIINEIIYDPELPFNYFMPGSVAGPADYVESPTGMSLPADWLAAALDEPAVRRDGTFVIGSPPDDFDPAQARLRFVWLAEGSPGSADNPTALLLASGYALDYITLGDPFTLACERSPDGRFIAVINDPDIPMYGSDGIRYWDLEHPGFYVNPYPDGTVGSDLAFTPDSQALAFFGCDNLGAPCGVQFHDIETGKTRMLTAMVMAYNFDFSPDGRLLALNGSRLNEGLHFMVLDVSTGGVVNKIPLSQLSVNPTSLVPEWEWPFEPEQTGLEGCVYPPER